MATYQSHCQVTWFVWLTDVPGKTITKYHSSCYYESSYGGCTAFDSWIYLTGSLCWLELQQHPQIAAADWQTTWVTSSDWLSGWNPPPIPSSDWLESSQITSCYWLESSQITSCYWLVGGHWRLGASSLSDITIPRPIWSWQIRKETDLQEGSLMSISSGFSLNQKATQERLTATVAALKCHLPT